MEDICVVCYSATASDKRIRCKQCVYWICGTCVESIPDDKCPVCRYSAAEEAHRLAMERMRKGWEMARNRVLARYADIDEYSITGLFK